MWCVFWLCAGGAGRTLVCCVCVLVRMYVCVRVCMCASVCESTRVKVKT